MTVDNRDLAVGTRLVARYKKQDYVCVVLAAESGEGVVYALQGGKTHKSPSSAGMEVMGGKAVNGWRFWSVEGEAPAAPETIPAPTRATAKAQAPAKARKVIYRNPNQKGVAQGSTRWFCTACMAGFVVTNESELQACPEGHRNDDAELATAPDPAAVAADKAEVEA